MKQKELIDAHKFSINNRCMLLENEKCGCFYCLRIFNTGEIKEWIDENNTALCPYCGIDAIIREGSKLQVTEKFLKKMKEYWF